MKKLLEIQAELKCPKGSLNKFGNYKYRSAEQILESVKPLLQKQQPLPANIKDKIPETGITYLIKAAQTIITELIDKLKQDPNIIMLIHITKNDANPEIANLPNWVIAFIAAGALAAALSTAAGLLLVIASSISFSSLGSNLRHLIAISVAAIEAYCA